MNMRICLPASIVWVMLLTIGGATAQPAELPTVTIPAAEGTVSELLREVSAQTDVKLYLGETPGDKIQVYLHEAELEQAIHAVCEPASCSWVRVYLLEPANQELEQYDFATLVRWVTEARRQRFEGMSREEREAMAQEISDAAMAADAATDRPDAPIGGWRATVEAGGDALLDRTARWAMTDPLRLAASPAYLDPVSLQVADATIEEFAAELSDVSGFILISRLGEQDRLLTIEATEAEVDEIVALAAEQLGCDWRRVYLVAHVRQLTDEQIDQRMDGMFTAGMGAFWNQPPQRRAEIIDRVVRGAQQIAPEQQRQIRSSRLARRMFTRVMQYANTLPMDQRREIMPLLQAAGQIMGR